MKTLAIISILLLFLIFQVNMAKSQTDSTKTVKIKIIKEVDGVTTILDTTYQVNADETEPEITFSSGKSQSSTSDNSSNKNYTNQNNSAYTATDLSAELEQVFNSIAESLPVVETYFDESGTKVYMLRNCGERDIELMKKCNNSIFIDNEEFIVPTIKFESNENGSGVLIIKKRCGTEVEVEKIDFPKITYPSIDVVQTDKSKQVIISNNGETSKIAEIKTDDDEIQTLFGNKSNSSDELETEIDLLVDKSNKNIEKEEIISTNSSNIVLVESNESQLKKLHDKNIETEFNSNKENLPVENFNISKSDDNSKILINFSLPEKDEITVKIYDIDLNLIFTEEVTKFKGNYKKQVEIVGNKEGIYFIQIIQGYKIDTRHFIVSK